MKLRVLLLMAVGAAGLGASYALADGGHGHNAGLQAASCQRAHVSGSVAAPQTLTVTVSKDSKDGLVAPGQVVTVSIGSAGRAVRINVEGCANGSALTANQAELLAVMPPPTTTAMTTTTGKHHGDHHGDGDHRTTQTATTTTTGP